MEIDKKHKHVLPALLNVYEPNFPPKPIQADM